MNNIFRKLKEWIIELVNYCDCLFDPEDNPFPESCDKRIINTDYCKNKCPWRNKTFRAN